MSDLHTEGTRSSIQPTCSLIELHDEEVRRIIVSWSFCWPRNSSALKVNNEVDRSHFFPLSTAALPLYFRARTRSFNHVLMGNSKYTYIPILERAVPQTFQERTPNYCPGSMWIIYLNDPSRETLLIVAGNWKRKIRFIESFQSSVLAKI